MATYIQLWSTEMRLIEMLPGCEQMEGVKMRLTIVVIATLSILSLPFTHASAQRIKLGTLAPEGSPWYNIIRDMAQAWREGSGGKIKVRIYPGGVVGDDPDMVRKMRVGQIHAAVLSGRGLSDIAPEIQALQMPMMLTSYEQLDYVRDRLAPKLEAILEAKGFKVLNWGDAGWVHFFTQKPVVHSEDLKPLKLFVWSGDTVYVEAWREAGYHPVPLAATDIHAALQSGLINAFPTTPIAALSFQWFGLAKHMTDLKWAPLIGATVISTRTWRKIPDDLKPLLLESAQEAGRRIRRETRKLGDDAVAVMKRHGLVVHHVPPHVAAEWEKSARAAYPKFVGKVVPAEMVAEVERLRNEYRVSQRRQSNNRLTSVQ
ncbi:MAG: TRAP transporter substrate-binding protein DctP [Candidatus Binatia bacterium]